MELDDSNKVAIFDAGGVSSLASRLKSAPDPQERGLVAAVLWNLSACEEIKPYLLEVSYIPSSANLLVILKLKIKCDFLNNFNGVFKIMAFRMKKC